MQKRAKQVIAVLFLSLPGLGFATPYYGAVFSYALIPKEPADLHGFQLMVNYDPERFQWRKFNIYFDAGYSHFWDHKECRNHVINIYSIAPVIRYTFKQRRLVLPYLELSIGVGYMDQTRIQSRNLGIHFTFQDRIGIGAFFGNNQQFSLGVHAVHYSNAHISNHNSGLSVPVELDLGYRFT